jgi:CheY-like chemotaxis protein
MNKRILVVDDAPDFSLLLERVLPDYTFRQALTAKEALSIAAFWRPHLFILDIGLGDMSGIDLARIIASDPEFRSVPIIYVSASIETREGGVEPVSLNGSAAFGKPFKLEAFRRCVIAALREEAEAVVIQPMQRIPARAVTPAAPVV